jgi:hypothetical protein
MNYKNFRTLMFALLGFMVISACTNLESEFRDSLLVEDASGKFTGIDPAEGVLAGYKDLAFFIDQDRVYCLYDHTSDEMIPPTRGTDWGDNGVWRSLHQHTWDATHEYVLQVWNGLNQRVFKTGLTLDPASAPNAQQAAEAKFQRAFFMFHVMDLYGQVPFRGVNEGIEVNPRVFTRSEAFDFIEKDLLEALPALPTAGPSATNTTANKAAANALLARMYLNKAVYKAARAEGPYTFDAADMAKVVQYCDAVTANGYSLESEYFTNFSNAANKEIIFTALEGNLPSRWHMTMHYDQNPGGWNGFATLADFYNKFEAGDARRGNYPTPNGAQFSGVGRGFLTGQQFNDNGGVITNSRNGKPLVFLPEVRIAGAPTDAGYRVIKYHPSNAGKYILLRYADVYLMKAEALFRSNQAGQALQMVNDLRALRGASPLGTLSEANLLDERGRELYWEGIRRQDQIRFGTWDDTWGDKTKTDAFRVLFPIPQQALDSNPNLKQNPGY